MKLCGKMRRIVKVCKRIVEAHDGTIGFETQVEQGSTFWVRLPVACTVDGTGVRTVTP